MQAVRILLAEDDERYALRLQKNLESERIQVEVAADGQAALDRLQRESFDLVLADIKMPRMDGLELLKTIKGNSVAGVDRDLPVIVLTSVDSVSAAVEAMRAGAEDYLTKTAEWDEILVHLNRALDHSRRSRENELLRRQVAAQSPFNEVIALSEAMGAVLKQVEDIAATQATVLITGETGVGKELIARAIHQRSLRRDGPFLEVNCAGLPDDNMFQSELFGHERGAFTGAYEKRKGRFELAHGGTLFLDEVGDLSVDSQAKILRVLETRTFERLGGSRKIQVDVRFILATNRPLQKEVEAGRFRRDLYYRINVVHIHIPPLRQRPEDIEALVQYYEERFRQEYRRPALRFTPQAMQVLQAHSWPGNVRELRNVLERLALVGAGGTITARDLEALGLGVQDSGQEELVRMPEEGISLEALEQSAILQALRRTDWVQKDAAELLHISVDRMNARIRKYGITHPKWKRHRGESPGE
ncbi:MAG TPA: sigma-54-dependent Fis family transcriptional regulator [Firmicutes bacterium]|nr:sigma-54-dependent Fis family transcriptional regulator [Bacillota bacterium]